jgi:hypothetical protein
MKRNPSEASYRLATSKLVQATRILDKVDKFLAKVVVSTYDIKISEEATDIHFQIMNYRGE